jgi:hypothetical protein
VRQNVERLPVTSAEEQLQRSLRHPDRVDQCTRGAVYKHFTGGEINIPLCIDRDSLAALLGKEHWAGDRSILTDRYGVGLFFRFIEELRRFSGSGGLQTESPDDVVHFDSIVEFVIDEVLLRRNKNALVREKN